MVNLLILFLMVVMYMDAHVMEEKDNACRTIAQFAQMTG